MNDNKLRKNIRIFCDFDGTITIKDLGDEIFKKFGQFEPFHSQLVSGEINIIEYWNKIVPTLSGTKESEIEQLALNSDIDSYFEKFIKICSGYKYELSIISDGFSSYINPILKSLRAEKISVFCNKIDFSGKPKPVFYGASESCKCLCASCKRNVIINNSDDTDIIVFIGDGYSDFCAAEHSDIIFAKKNLAEYCSKNRIPFYNYKTFFDINKIFDNLHSGKVQFRKRRQAELKRKQAYETE